MRKLFHYIVVCAVGICLMPGVSQAHFGMVIPSASVVENKQTAALHFDLAFAHPMECQGMALARPQSVRVFQNGGGVIDVTRELKPATFMGKDAFTLDWQIRRPGLIQVVMDPEPYWEPAEDCFIRHITKTCVSAFGFDEGWDTPLGLPVEIVPLSRPFGGYAGNVFQGRVLQAGKPVPNCTVEVEFYNREAKRRAPNGAMVTQVVKTDDTGVFTYGVPFDGWWGFAALLPAPEKRQRNGVEKDVELGAVMWVEFIAPVSAR